MRNLATIFVLLCLTYFYTAWAQEGVFTVTTPSPGAPYVAGQKLPLVYQVSANTTSALLRLSISLENPKNMTDNVVMVPNADISQGYSEKKELGDGKTVVYEHQVNYDIPKDKAPGEYNVVYTNEITQYKTTVPIRISAASTSEKPLDAQKPGGTNSIFSAGAQTINVPQLITFDICIFITLFVFHGIF